MSHPLLRLTIHTFERMFGRTRVVKLSRLMTNESRLDASNSIDVNGEQIVQQVARRGLNPVVLDVGAHYGEWSSSLLDQPGHAPTLHLFEPSSYSATRARAAIGARGTVHALALSDRPGAGELLIVHDGAGSNSLVTFFDPTRTSGDKESIELTTVDLFCQAEGIKQVRLLKVDAEGHDLSVIRGASSMLRKGAVEMVQFEYNHRWIDARVFLADAFDLLSGFGYEMGKVTPRGIEMYDTWHPELEKFVEGNYLAFLPDIRPELPAVAWWGP